MSEQSEYSFLFYQDEHISCVNYKSSLDFGFKEVKLKAGETIKSELMPRHNLLLQISGRTSLICDQYEPSILGALEMILIPRYVNFTATVLEDTHMVIFGFEVPLSSCDKHRLESYAPICERIIYDFRPTPIRRSIELYLQLLVHYLSSGVNCVHMHESKHRELFLCLKAFYSKEEIAYLLHPVIGHSLDFRNLMLVHSDSFTCVNDMVALSNMSRTQFFRSFKETFGTTAKQWLLKHQIQKIRFAAARPNVSVKEVMFEVGFDDSPQFTQFCKLHCGYTPSELIESMKPEQL